VLEVERWAELRHEPRLNQRTNLGSGYRLRLLGCGYAPFAKPSPREAAGTI
jgi:hypothetical protein